MRASVNGVVTNLDLHPGDYVGAGSQAMALIDSDTLRIEGYFEETKLDSIDVGAPVRVQLLSSDEPIWGHVDSFARGISDSSLSSQENGLASVNASFDWVRLSQRIPVRIALDEIPEGTKLSAGLTATVYLESDRQGREEAPDWWKPIRQWWEGLISI